MAELKLHLGCGTLVLPGWVNIDLHTQADVRTDVTSLHMYAADSVDKIYTSHMIEHLHPFDLQKGLAEWLRVLKPAGILMVRCPYANFHLQRWLDATDEARYDLQTGLRNAILGHHKSYDQPGHIHQNLFSAGLLKIYLAEAGFVGIETHICSRRNPELNARLKEGLDDEPLIIEGYSLSDLWARAFKGT